MALEEAPNRGLSGHRAFRPFHCSDFRAAARAFAERGYLTLDAVSDAGGREHGLSPTHAKNETRARGRNCLSGHRMALEICARFERTPKIRDLANTGFGEIDSGQRASSWAAGFSALQCHLAPGRDVANFFLGRSGRRAISSADVRALRSTGIPSDAPAVPAGEAHIRPWANGRLTNARFTDTQGTRTSTSAISGYIGCGTC